MSIAERIRTNLAAPIFDDSTIEPLAELKDVLSGVGLRVEGSGGSIEFVGADPILTSPWPLATMAGVSLMAKSVAIADLWRTRTGESQDLSVDLRQAPHRLCPFYDQKWELLNGYPPASPSDPKNSMRPSLMYPTRDGRWIQLGSLYPRVKAGSLALLNCTDDPESIGRAVRGWDGKALEEEANNRGLAATLVRTPEEFLATEQFDYLQNSPLVEIVKIGESDPVPFKPQPKTPFDGIRALGLAHVIAGPGLGRALAYHGADVLNIWRPVDFEVDFLYYTANVGLRSSTLDVDSTDGRARFDGLLKDADIFFSNRRPGFLAQRGLTAEELSQQHPGLVHVEMSLYGWGGPWAARTGFDLNAGGAAGIFTREGTPENPAFTEILVVNDYVVSWLSAMAVTAALKRRAVEGGSYRIRISLARVSVWLLQMGLFDKDYSRAIAGSSSRHEYLAPELFVAETPCGVYQGVTDLVNMSRTPGSYKVPLVPRGSSKPAWL